MDSIIEGIFTLMENDSEDQTKQSDQLEAFYEVCTDAQKKIINNVMICICGYSLDTIINNPQSISLEDDS